METKTIEVCDAIMVDVTCAHNDYKDIISGGPATLGYEFYVNPDEDKVELDEFIKGCLKQFDRPLISIKYDIKNDYPVKKLWTSEKMVKCIKENAVA